MFTKRAKEKYNGKFSSANIILNSKKVLDKISLEQRDRQDLTFYIPLFLSYESGLKLHLPTL